jgi:hypothetical protein
MSLSANWQLPLLPLTNHKAATRWVTFQLTTSRLSYISGELFFPGVICGLHLFNASSRSPHL